MRETEFSSGNISCAFPNCLEYHSLIGRIGDGVSTYIGDFATYAGTDLYAADFSYEMDYLNITSALKANYWIDDNTKAILLRFTVFNIWTEKYYHIKATTEMPSVNFMSNSFSINFISLKDTEKELIIVLIILLGVNCLVFMGKIVFELSIGLSIFTNLLEILNIVSIIAFSVAKLVQFSLESNFTNKISNTQFYNFETLVDINYVANFLAIFSILFVPFRFFTLLSHFKFFTPFATMIKIFYRMLAELGVLILIIAVIILTWTSILYFFLEPFLFKFRTFQDSVMAVILYDFWNDKDYQVLIQESRHSYIFSFIIAIVQLVRSSTLILYIALSVFLYKKAADFEKLQKNLSDIGNYLFLVLCRDCDTKSENVY